MYKILIISFIFNIFSGEAGASSHKYIASRYQLKDLEVLENQKSFREFFAHAKDVLPSLRNKNWKQMVQSMAMSYLNNLRLTDGNINPKDYLLINDISKWSTLKNDEFFIKNRDQTLIKYYNYCFKNSEFQSCYKKALRFYKKNKTHPEFGFTFLKNVIKTLDKNNIENDFHINYQLELWPFIDSLVKSSISEFYCAQSPLKEAIEQKILQESYKDSNFKVLDNLHPDCWKVIKKGLISTLFKYTDAYSRKKVFKTLKGTVRLSKTDTYLYIVLQMLSGINLNAKETMNYWDHMKKLSKDYKLREILLKKLKSYSTLPGDVFLGATKQQKLITKAFVNYFPEYIDFYATTCIEHLNGSRETAGGNPATKCHQLFKLSKSIKLLPKSKVYQYTKLTTF